MDEKTLLDRMLETADSHEKYEQGGGASAVLYEGVDEINRLNSDCMTLVLRLFGEDPDTFGPETRKVMDRWRPKAVALLNGQEN